MLKKIYAAISHIAPGAPLSVAQSSVVPLAVALSVALLSVFCTRSTAQTVPPVRVNQESYYPYAPKFAVVVFPMDNTTGSPGKAVDVFYVLSARTHDTAYSGSLGPLRRSANSSLTTRIADFSILTQEGVYEIVVPGLGNSYSFTIGVHAAAAPSRASLKGFYYQRSAMALTPVYAGQWSRPAGHPDTSVLIHPSAASEGRPAGTVVAAPGGWYDAGDYNKYIVNSGITMGTLLAAYEDFPEYFDTLHTNIPPIAATSGSIHSAESAASSFPDILNEALYNLRWMLTMQDPADGGVYNKCTNAGFDGMVMPGLTKAPRYVVQKGTAATLDFAAVTAQAARILRKFPDQLPGLADSCLRAARRAWSWAIAHPAIPYDQESMNKLFEPKVMTGGYGDWDFRDEWYWAAVELMVTVTVATPADPAQAKACKKIVEERIGDPAGLPGWGNVHGLGDYTLLRFRNRLPATWGPAIMTITQHLLQTADNYLAGVSGNAFHTVIGGTPKDFVWGSNAVAANQGILLINAWLQTRERKDVDRKNADGTRRYSDDARKYIDGALDNLDYILGRNATGYCFITGIGSHPTMHPHHRQSVADGIAPPVPGLLAGGPNPGRQDHQHYEFTEPETAYLDREQAYASNEVAINWNAPLVYLAGALEALQYRVGYCRYQESQAVIESGTSLNH